MFGGSIPARIWHDFMIQATAGMPIESFATPSFIGYDYFPPGTLPKKPEDEKKKNEKKKKKEPLASVSSAAVQPAPSPSPTKKCPPTKQNCY